MLAACIAAGATLALPSPATAAEGLGLRGAARYVVSADGSPVRVTQEVTATNQSPSTATLYYYWSELYIWLPTKVNGLRASSNGAALGVRVVRRNGYDYAMVTLPSRLLYGQSRTVTISYEIPGSPPRSADLSRVGKGYASLPVAAEGDAGAATITVESPEAMTVDIGVTGATSTTSGRTRITTITGGRPTGIAARIALRDPSKKLTKDVSVDGRTFVVEAWPGDREWLSFVSSTLPKAIPALEKVSGERLPLTRTFITEDASVGVYGWDGLYSGSQGTATIRISERTETWLLAHELAHAWSNSGSAAERWISEGLASAMTTRAMAIMGTKDLNHKRVNATQSGAFPLLEWEHGDARSLVPDTYGYPGLVACDERTARRRSGRRGAQAHRPDHRSRNRL